jgi:hypothetical protein
MDSEKVCSNYGQLLSHNFYDIVIACAASAALQTGCVANVVLACADTGARTPLGVRQYLRTNHCT